MAAVKIHVHQDRMPHPVKRFREFMKGLGEKSPITISVEKVDPIIEVITVDAGASAKVQREMDGSPALPGELEELPQL